MPGDAIFDLRRRLAPLPPRAVARRAAVARTAEMYGVSIASVDRALQLRAQPRSLDEKELEHYCEVIAALKLCTRNRKGRHLSTVRAIELLEHPGVETPDGHVQAPPGRLTRSTVNRGLNVWGFDHKRLTRPPPAVRFEARHSNDCWHFDMSPSDLKQIAQPEWIDPARGPPTLTLFSVVDDRSGVAYQEYRCVYGEDAESALRFLFNAMSAKDDNPLQGIPDMIYTDNGPATRAAVFGRVMEHLAITVQTHRPAGSDGNRVTARSKGKVERPFRTVKEAHETLYHFHQPQTEEEANVWLKHYLKSDNDKPHRRESQSRTEDWSAHVPDTGLRTLCSWERYCAFARDPETRKVGADARVQVGGAHDEVDPDLAGETVTLWWGLFDQELFVEWQDRKFGPDRPWGGPIPLHRYRKPRTALSGGDAAREWATVVPLRRRGFDDPDPWQEVAFPDALQARRAIADQLRQPLGALGDADLDFIRDLVNRTLNKAEITTAIDERFQRKTDTC
ncbi:MAG: IS481 family transposase [Rhodobacteraceae bacterium]|nr:IS481 family transposase [Paracoccaceae bacterium]